MIKAYQNPLKPFQSNLSLVRGLLSYPVIETGWDSRPESLSAKEKSMLM